MAETDRTTLHHGEIGARVVRRVRLTRRSQMAAEGAVQPEAPEPGLREPPGAEDAVASPDDADLRAGRGRSERAVEPGGPARNARDLHDGRLRGTRQAGGALHEETGRPTTTCGTSSDGTSASATRAPSPRSRPASAVAGRQQHPPPGVTRWTPCSSGSRVSSRGRPSRAGASPRRSCRTSRTRCLDRCRGHPRSSSAISSATTGRQVGHQRRRICRASGATHRRTRTARTADPEERLRRNVLSAVAQMLTRYALRNSSRGPGEHPWAHDRSAHRKQVGSRDRPGAADPGVA